MKSQLKDVLNKVYQKKISPEEALRILKDYPYQDLDFAKIDHHRELRKGFPEIIYGQGKTEGQILKIAQEIIKKGGNLLVTKVGAEVYETIARKIPKARYNSLAKIIFLKQTKPLPGKGKIVILTAGTSDVPVAEEAAVTCDILGDEVEKIYDVGVAGIHRLFGEYEKIKKARVVVVVAGMEGALPSVIA